MDEIIANNKNPNIVMNIEFRFNIDSYSIKEVEEYFNRNKYQTTYYEEVSVYQSANTQKVSYDKVNYFYKSTLKREEYGPGMIYLIAKTYSNDMGSDGKNIQMAKKIATNIYHDNHTLYVINNDNRYTLMINFNNHLIKEVIDEYGKIFSGNYKNYKYEIYKQVWSIYSNEYKEEDFEMNMSRYKWLKPKTIKKEDIEKVVQNYYICQKNDGVRSFICVIENGVYDCKDKRYLFPANNIDDIMILDVEIVGRDIYILDIILHNSVLAVNKNFNERKEMYMKLQEGEYINEAKNMKYNIKYKEYKLIEKYEDIYEQIEIYEKKEKCDGIIFVSKGKYSDKCYKFKWVNTIDLMYKDGKFVSKNNTEYNVKVTEDFEEDVVYEFSVLQGNIENLVKVRHDKEIPNTDMTISDILRNNIDKKYFSGIGCFAMRNYHKAVKKAIISDLSSGTLIDIGSGQGSDINSWISSRVNEIICVEPKEIIELHKRIQNTNKKQKKIYVINETISELVKKGYMQPYAQNQQNYINVNAFFCINQFTQEDFQALYKIVDMLNIKSINIIYMSKPSEIENDKYQIKYVERGKKYIINIKNSYLQNQKENVLAKKDIENIKNYFEQKEYNVNIMSINNELSQYVMTKEEHKLSSYYKIMIINKKIF